MYFFMSLDGAWSLLACLIYMAVHGVTGSPLSNLITVYLDLLTKAANVSMSAAGGY
jgi:hypothetical protein